MGQRAIGQMPSVQFYKDLTKAKTMISMPDSNLREKINISISLEDCGDYEYQFKVFDITTQPPKLLDSSEVVKADYNKVVVFQKSFIMEYFFEKDQQILVSIFKNSLGGDSTKIDFKSSVGSIVGSRNNTLIKKIDNNNPETIKISAIELKHHQHKQRQ